MWLAETMLTEGRKAVVEPGCPLRVGHVMTDRQLGRSKLPGHHCREQHTSTGLERDS